MTKTERENWEGDKNQRKEEGMEGKKGEKDGEVRRCSGRRGKKKRIMNNARVKAG